MALELHLREHVLARALTAYVQTQLFTMCGPVIMSEVLVDHLDTVPGSVTVTETPGSRLEVRLGILIHTVLRSQVLANPNASPPTNPAVGAVVVVRLAVQGQALVVDRAFSDTSATQLPPALRTALKSAIDARLAPLVPTTLVDLAPVVQALASEVPADPSLGRAGGVLGLRLGGSGAFTPQLAADQAWGVFLDANEAMALLTRRARGVPATVRWLPDGATPAMEARLAVGAGFLGAAARVTARPTLVLPSTLRLSVDWSVDLTGVAFFLEPMARKLVRQWVRRQFSTATHDGAFSFHFDLPLPAVPAFLGARPEWRSLDSSPAGMTIGGPVHPSQDGNRGLLSALPKTFGRPWWFGNCRRHGEAPRHFERSDPRLRVAGGVAFSDAGRVCDVEVLEPNGWMKPLLQYDANSFGFNLSVGTAQKIADDVKLFVWTARGARFINLGRPTIRPGSDGTGIDVQVNFLDNCPMLSGAMLKLALGEQLVPEDFKPDPLEYKDWVTTLEASLGLVSHLVVLERLDPGETVTVRGRSLAVEMTADDAGRLTVPALVGMSSSGSDVVVERSNGDMVEGSARVLGTQLTWLAELGPAQAAAMVALDDGVRVVREVDGTWAGEEYRPGEGVVTIDVGSEVQLNPQPLPPEPPDAMRLAVAAGLDDVRSAQAMPGFDASQLAVVELGDGERVVVTSDGDAPHVAGRYHGPVVGMQVDGQYALATSGATVHLFAVTPLPEMVV